MIDISYILPLELVTSRTWLTLTDVGYILHLKRVTSRIWFIVSDIGYIWHLELGIFFSTQSADIFLVSMKTYLVGIY